MKHPDSLVSSPASPLNAWQRHLRTLSQVHWNVPNTLWHVQIMRPWLVRCVPKLATSERPCVAAAVLVLQSEFLAYCSVASVSKEVYAQRFQANLRARASRAIAQQIAERFQDCVRFQESETGLVFDGKKGLESDIVYRKPSRFRDATLQIPCADIADVEAMVTLCEHACAGSVVQVKLPPGMTYLGDLKNSSGSVWTVQIPNEIPCEFSTESADRFHARLAILRPKNS